MRTPFTALALALFLVSSSPAQDPGLYSDADLEQLRHSPEDLQAVLADLQAPPDTYPAPDEDPDVRAAVEEYAETGKARVLYQSDVAVFPYGESQPTLVCAPLRLCLIELQSGESVINVAAGDKVRWIFEQASAGPGGAIPLVIVKPTQCDATTNLFITTSRRIYDLTLDSPPCDEEDLTSTNPQSSYTRRVSFYYPADVVSTWTTREQLLAQDAQHARQGRIPLADTPHPTDLNFHYDLEAKRRHVPWIPRNVFDDGIHTYIQLPLEDNPEMPVLYEVSADDDRQLLNYRVQDDYLITDHVLARGVLVWSHKRKPRELRIVNEAL